MRRRCLLTVLLNRIDKSVNAHIGIIMVYKDVECGQDLLNGVVRRWRFLVATQIHDHPGHVAQEAQGDGRVDEGQQGLHHAHTDHIVPALGAIT